MASRPRSTESVVVPLFDDEDAFEIEALPMGGQSFITQTMQQAPVAGPVADLNSMLKLLVTIGSGGVGKTTYLRWGVDYMLDAGRTPYTAAIDPINRDFRNFYDVIEPKGNHPTVVMEFLKRLIGAIVQKKSSYLLDTGGGDTAFGQLIGSWPTLVDDLAEEGIAMVAIYLFSPRPADVTILSMLEDAGFKPKATALILNEGRVEPGRDPDQEFAELRRQTAYREALARGAVELRMPGLDVAKKVQDRMLTFTQALKAGRTTADGKTIPGLGWSDRRILQAWLARMRVAMGPIIDAGWIP